MIYNNGLSDYTLDFNAAVENFFGSDNVSIVKAEIKANPLIAVMLGLSLFRTIMSIKQKGKK